jgi:hypothetical protein
MPAKNSELQRLAQTHSLPFLHIFPSAGSTVENSSIFDALTKNLTLKKVVGTVRFPLLGPNAGMILIYNEKRFYLIGLLFIKVPLPNLNLNMASVVPAVLQQQQQLQQQLQQQQQLQAQQQQQQQQGQPGQVGVNSPNMMSPSNAPGGITPQQQTYLTQARLIQQQRDRFLAAQQQQQQQQQQQPHNVYQQQLPQVGQGECLFVLISSMQIACDI